MLTRMLQRRGTTAQWNDVKSTLILAAGEVGFVTDGADANKFKIGDGVTTWENLKFYLRDDQNAGIYAKLIAAQTFLGSQVLTPNTAITVPLIVSGATSQSADLQRWRDSSNNTLASIDATGKITAAGGLFNSTVNVNSNKITNVAAPTEAGDATNKQYVDDVIAGLAWKAPVNLISASGLNTFINVPLTGDTGTVVLDGHSALDQTESGYRILLLAQTTSSDNGIYVYTDNGTSYTLTRAADANAYTELKGASVFVEEGTSYGTSSWVQTNHYLSSFSGQSWVQFNGASQINADGGLTKVGNTLAVGAGDGITVNADNVAISTGGVTSAMIANGTIVDGDINSSAAIAATKISGTAVTQADTGTVTSAMIANGTIVDADINSSAAIDASKIFGTAVTYSDTGTVTSAMIANDTIVNADINASAAIAQSKIANLVSDLAGKSSTSHTHAIDDLSDVVITGTPVTRQVIKYNGTNWVNELPSGGISVSATAPVGPSSGDAWMDSNDGSLYVYYNDTTSRPAGTNLITNPSFETDTNSWSKTSATLSQSSAFSFVGIKSMKVVPSANTGKASFTATTVVSTVYRFSAYVYTEINKNIRVSVTSPATNGTTTAVTYGNWTRLDVSFTANALSTEVNIESIDSTDPFYVDAVMLEASASLNDYFDGSSYNSTWTGTAHASTSTTAGGTTSQWVQVRANSALEATILTRMSAVESRATNLEAANPVVVGSVAARSALFPAPVQGNTVFRTDLGYMERYYTAYDAVTNPSGTTGTVGWYKYAGGAPLSDNYMINGALDIWQRGTSFAPVSNTAFTADRWQAQASLVSTSRTIQQLSLAQAITGLEDVPYYLRSTVNTIGTGTNTRIRYKVEDVKTLAGKTVTFSWYGKQNIDANLRVLIQQNFGTGGSTSVTAYDANSAYTSSWKRFSATFTLPSVSGKTISADSFIQIELFQSDTTGGALDVTAFQLEEGPVATAFRRNQTSIQAELLACQRYYYRKTASGQTFEFGTGFASGTGQIFCAINFPVQMRATPSTTPDISDYTTFAIEGIGTPGSVTGTSTSPGSRTNPYSAYLNLYTSGLTSGQAYRVISGFNAAAYIGFSAEL